MAVDHLDRLKNYVDGVLNQLDTFERQCSTDLRLHVMRTSVSDLRDKARKVAQVLESPVRIGVVGGFNAGKTMLILSLLGQGGILPVKGEPATGNVTRIHIDPVKSGVPDNRPSGDAEFSLEFLTRDEAEACLTDMLHELAEKLLESRQADHAERARRFAAEALGKRAELEVWAKDVWNATASPVHRRRIDEILWFSRCWDGYANRLRAARAGVQVSSDTAHAAMMFPKRDISFGFDAIPKVSPEDVEALDLSRLTPDFVRQIFPLVRRVDVRVPVHHQDWRDLGAAGGVVLLDFPGLGAEETGARDLHLCRREMHNNVETILILLDAGRPGAKDGEELFNYMQGAVGLPRNRILVGLGRFDKHDAFRVGDTRIQDLVKSEASADQTLERITELDRLLKEALRHLLERDLQNGDRRIVALSPVLGFLRLLERGADIGPNDFRHEHVTPNSASALRAADLARDLAAALAARDPASPLVEILRDVSEDGGLARLRAMLARHVGEHGLEQLRKSAWAAGKDFEAAVADFGRRSKSLMVQRVLPDTMVVEDIQTALERMADDLNEAAILLEKARSDLDLPDSNDPDQPTLLKRLSTDMVSRVYKWEAWKSLLENVKDNFIEGTPRVAGRPGRFARAATPNEAMDLFDPFAKAIKEGEAVMWTLLDAALEHQLRQLAGTVASNAARLLPRLGGEAGSTHLATRLGLEDSIELRRTIELAANPTGLKSHIITYCKRGKLDTRDEDHDEETSPATDPVPDIDPVAVFPHREGQLFAWAPQVRQQVEQPDQRFCHQMYGLEIRQELIACLLHAHVTRASRIAVRANRHTRHLLTDLANRLRKIAATGEDVEALAEASGIHDVRPVAAGAEAPTTADPFVDAVTAILGVPPPLGHAAAQRVGP